MRQKDLPAAKLAAQLIQQGFASQALGELQQALACYQAALDNVPEHPAALQLMGLLARKRGDLQAAEELMRRSLAVSPTQPNVWNNLANVLDAGQRSEEALHCLEQAIVLSPDYADAHFNRARLLLKLKRFGLAKSAAESALAVDKPARHSLLQLYAQIQTELGELQPALTTLNLAIAQYPTASSLHHNRAVLLQRLHRYKEALADHQAALGGGLDAADAHYNHGNTLQSLGLQGQALEAYRRALARQPLHALALYDLARLRWRRGDDDFDAELVQASMAHPTSALAPTLRGQLLLRAELHAQAVQSFQQALLRDPQSAQAHDGVARALARLGLYDESLVHHTHASELAPSDAAIRVGYATTLLMARKANAAVAQALAACELAPDDQSAWAALGLAWRLCGDARESWLNNESQLIAVLDLAAPFGFETMDAFNSALAAELALLHQDRIAPVDQTLRGGTQTLGDIFDQRHPLVEALKQRIGEATSSYISNLARDDTHPFLRRLAARWRFAGSWSSRLSSGGFHTNHVHPQGWISGVYYVAVPATVQAGESRAGALEFGRPDFAFEPKPTLPFCVQPRPGRLVLFPSMFWHGTVPFFDSADRVTIAFDVVPG
jgi:uncharacterized protein (TIGR02466 family)